jgi:signal transduction histidine kinase
MINDILDLSQISNGKLRLSFNKVNIIELVKEVMDLIEFQAREKGIHCEIICSEPNPLFIYTDGNRIRQVLLNLLSNALKFTNKGRTLKLFSILNFYF